MAASKSKKNSDRWGPEDDAKLAALYKAKKLDPLALDSKSVHKAHAYWPNKKFNSFSTTYKRKANAWNLNQDLQGERKGGKRPGSGRKRTIGDFADDDDEGEDYEDDEEEDVELEADDDIGEEAKNPPAKTPKQQARAKKIEEIKQAGNLDELTEQVSKMSVQTKSYDMTIKCPYIMYDYVQHNRKVASVDFLVPNQHRRFFRLVVKDNKILALEIVIPKQFYNKNRVLSLMKSKSKKANKNTHKATAFAARCEEIEKDLGHDVPIADGDEDDFVEVFDGEQLVELPFTVEEQLCRGPKEDLDGFEVIALENDDPVLFDELEEGTNLFVLSVDMVSNEKPKVKKARGAMSKLKSPDKYYDSSDEEEEQEQMEEGGGDA